MYSTCLYCSKGLGANEVMEALPIGRRIAFDPAHGRLWVVCRSCEKWNLVPFDTRLETIDRCDRLFAEARLRFSTDNIGIARLNEGLELVRIGPAQRPEFASWRYGDQFGRRRKRYAVQIGAAIVGASAFVVGGHALVPLLKVAGLSGTFGIQAFNWGSVAYRSRRAVVRIPERDGVGGIMTAPQVRKAAIVGHGPSGWSLRLGMHRSARRGFVGFGGQTVDLWGSHAAEALGQLLPSVNAKGGSRNTVRDAVQLVEGYQTVDGLIEAHRHSNFSETDQLRWLDARVRLALEMASHENCERLALAGELKLLEREWKAADELAKIADSLTLAEE